MGGLWATKSGVRLILLMRLVSKTSDLCDHYPPTSQTDRQGETDDMQSQDRSLHYIGGPSTSGDKNRHLGWLLNRQLTNYGANLNDRAAITGSVLCSYDASVNVPLARFFLT